MLYYTELRFFKNLSNKQRNIFNLPQSQRVGVAGYVKHEFSPDAEL